MAKQESHLTGSRPAAALHFRKWSRPAMQVKIFSWLKSTPLGSPVVPLVYMIVDISDPVGGVKSTGFSSPWKSKQTNKWALQRNKKRTQ
jgi:hypothetical protein